MYFTLNWFWAINVTPSFVTLHAIIILVGTREGREVSLKVLQWLSSKKYKLRKDTLNTLIFKTAGKFIYK